MVAVYSRADDFMGLHTLQPHPGWAAQVWCSFQPQHAALCSPYSERRTMKAGGVNIRAVPKISPHHSGQGEKMIWMGGDIPDTPKSLLRSRNPACSCAGVHPCPGFCQANVFPQYNIQFILVFPFCTHLASQMYLLCQMLNLLPRFLYLFFGGDQMICILMGEEGADRPTVTGIQLQPLLGLL